MEKLKPYPKYKPIDLPWLKEIPAHWRLKKIKYLFKERSQKGFPDEPLLAATQSMGVVPKDIYGERTVEVTKDFDTLKLVEVGDFVASLRSFQGGLEYAYYRGIISPAYTIITSRGEVLNEFFRHLAKSFPFIQLLKLCVKGIREGQNINYEVLKNAQIPVPPSDEQKKIVAFLDDKTAKIDKYIEAKSKEIELLKEQKNAEISNAVTRGLNPNTKFKPIDLPWLKEIPAHWGLRFLFQIASEHFISNKYIKEQNLLSLSYGKIIKKDINITEGLLPVSFDTYQVVKKGNVIIRPTDLQNDHRSLRVGLARERGIITSAYIAIEPSHELCPEYLYYLLHTYDLHKEFYRMGGGMRQSLKWRELRKLNFYIPSLDEQKKIIAFLDDKTEKYTKAISAIQRKIDLLKEYKTRLISDAVTGKIRV